MVIFFDLLIYTLLFAARSTKGIKKLSKLEREAIKINVDVMSCITGMMLSDRHIQQRSITGNGRFIFAQSGKLNKREYFNLVLEIMKPFCSVNYIPYVKEWTDNRTNTLNSSISLTTMQLPCFTDLRNIWYSNSIKKVPLNIQNMLTPIALAHWIWGDGSKQNEGIHLSVYAFSTFDVELLIKAFNNRYNIECSIHHTDRGPRIYISKNYMDILRPLVSSHIVPSMKYKIGL